MLYKEPTSGEVRPTFVSVADGAKILGGLPAFAVLTLAEAGEIRSTMFDGHRLLLLDSVEEYAKRMEARA